MQGCRTLRIAADWCPPFTFLHEAHQTLLQRQHIHKSSAVLLTSLDELHQGHWLGDATCIHGCRIALGVRLSMTMAGELWQLQYLSDTWRMPGLRCALWLHEPCVPLL